MSKFIIAVAICATFRWADSGIQPLNVKTGLWENTISITSNGQIPVSSDVLARLSPEQRARVEARMNAQTGPKTRTRTNQDCLTSEDLQRGRLFKNEEQACTQKIMASSSTHLEVQVDCQRDGLISKMVLSLQAISPELVKGTATTTVSSEGHSMTSKSDLSAHWLASSCGNRK